MGLIQDIFPFGFWKNMIPNDISKLKSRELKDDIPCIKIDYTGPFDEKKLTSEIMLYMHSNRWVFGEFITFQKGPEHNHILRGFRRLSDYYRVYCNVRIRVHSWHPSGIKEKPDSGYVRVWIGESKWEIRKDYQGWYKENATIFGIRLFFDNHFFKREYEDVILPTVTSAIYGVTAVIKKELGIETVSYEQGLPRERTWR